jgi:hypothetical protein
MKFHITSAAVFDPSTLLNVSGKTLRLLRSLGFAAF